MRISYQEPRSRKACRALVRRGHLGFIVVAALAVALAACSSSATSSSQAASSPSNGAAQTSGAAGSTVVSDSVARAQQIMTAATGGFVWSADGTSPVNAMTSWHGPAATVMTKPGKKIDVICAAPGACVVSAGYVQQAAAKLGWSTTITASPDSTPASFASLTDTAISQHPDAIAFFGIPDVTVPQQIQRARAAGILTLGVSSTQHTNPGFDAYITIRADLEARMYAYAVLAATHGKADVILTIPSGFPDYPGYAQGFSAIIKGCSACKYKIMPISNSDLIDPVQLTSHVNAMINSDPNLNFIVFFDDFVPLSAAVQAVRASGRNISIGTGDGGSTGVALVRSGSIAFDMGVAEEWIAYASVDNIARLLAKMPPTSPNGWGGGVHAWTKDNVPAGNLTDPSLQDKLSQLFDFKAQYSQLWKTS